MVSLVGAMATLSDEAIGHQKIDGMASNLRRVLVGGPTIALVGSLATSLDMATSHQKCDEALYS